MKIIQDKTFKDLTTFHIGGLIKYFAEVKDSEEIDEAVCFAKKNKLQIFILGGGSDVLMGDAEFNGLVIKYTGKQVKFLKNGIVKSEAGKDWDEFVGETVDQNFQGVECLSGIPGSVGASPIQNIGAYGQEIKDVFESLVAYDIEKEKFVEFSKEDCKFGYRESVFKENKYWQKFIITEVTLKLRPGSQPEIVYDSLKTFLNEKGMVNPTLREVRSAILGIRAGKFEKPKVAGNAGSFFKNPILTEKEAIELKEKYPYIPIRQQNDGMFKSSAGWFIEQAGWKGKHYKNAAVSPKHALIIINPEQKATAADVLELSDLIIKDVNKKFGVKLEREVQLVNF